jgi:hypothetical protein
MNQIRQTFSRGRATGLIMPLVLLTSTALFADDPPKKPAPAPAKPAAAAPKAAAGAAAHLPGAGGSHPATPAAGTHTPAAGAPHTGAPAAAGHPGGTVPGVRPGGAAPGAHPGGPAVGNRGGATAFKGPGRVEAGHNGAQFQRDSRGNVREIHRGDLAVHRGPAGSFRSERMRPDGSRLVGYRNGGYVEHGFRYGGHDVYRRNYYYGGRMYSRYYNPYAYHGVFLNVYAPAYYYGPGFYGYAYAPWGVPVAYSWGFAGSPWYGYYGGYFTPYPTYASPSLWLTDYLVAQSLQNAYQQQQAANAAAQQQQQSGYDTAAQQPAPLTPDVKQQIADEVRRQIALENAERQQATAPNSMPDPASSGIARMLSDNSPHVFVAGAPLNLVSAGGECAITEGDVLQLSGAPAPNAANANALVLASKGQDCAKGSTVQVALADLQDMQNHMRETIDQGMGELQKKQGTGGLPALPPSAAAPPTQTGFAAIAPPPDPAEANDVTKQVQDASQAEQDALAGALGGPSDSSSTPPATADASGAPPATVSMGQTTAQVEAIMGKPKSIANLPNRTIYVYDGLKVVFVNGKVSDVQ